MSQRKCMLIFLCISFTAIFIIILLRIKTQKARHRALWGDAFEKIDVEKQALITIDAALNKSGSSELEIGQAMLQKANCLIGMLRYDEGIQILKDLIDCFTDRDEPSLVELTAKARLALCTLLFERSIIDEESFEEANNIFEKLAQQCSHRDETTLLNLVTQAMFSKFEALENQADDQPEVKQPQAYQIALEPLQAIIDLITERDEEILVTRLIKAEQHKAQLLWWHLKRIDDALIGINNIIARFDKRHELAIQEQIGKALLFKSDIYDDEKSNFQDEINIYDDIVRRFQHSKDECLIALAMEAFLNKTRAFKFANKPSKALSIIDEFIHKFAKQNNDPLFLILVEAHQLRGELLTELNRPEEAITAYNNALSIFEARPYYAYVHLIIRLFTAKSELLLQQKQPIEAILGYDKAIDICNDGITNFMADPITIIKNKAIKQLKENNQTTTIMSLKIKRFIREYSLRYSLI